MSPQPEASPWCISDQVVGVNPPGGKQGVANRAGGNGGKSGSGGIRGAAGSWRRRLSCAEWQPLLGARSCCTAETIKPLVRVSHRDLFKVKGSVEKIYFGEYSPN